MISKSISDWQLFKGTNSEWDSKISLYELASYLDGSRWGSHLESFGWKCVRWEKETTKGKSFIQSFIKIMPFNLCIVWIPGGIVGDFCNIEGFQEDIKKILKKKFFYIKIRFQKKYELNEEIMLYKYNWEKSILQIGSNFKVLLKTNIPIFEIKKNFSRSWKRSLKSFDEEKYSIQEIKDYKLIGKLYKEMKTNKSLKIKNIYQDSQCKSILRNFKNHILVYGVKDEFGSFCSLRGVIFDNKKLFDIFAATNIKGRKINASHAILYKFISLANSRKVDLYDLANVDPQNNIGVFQFKKGTGGETIKTLGEFEWSNNTLINLFLKIFLIIKNL